MWDEFIHTSEVALLDSLFLESCDLLVSRVYLLSKPALEFVHSPLQGGYFLRVSLLQLHDDFIAGSNLVRSTEFDLRDVPFLKLQFLERGEGNVP
jgi:hypothetical protein